MKFVLTTFANTVAGKALLAAGVVTLSVGGAAAAAQIVDEPSLVASADESTDVAEDPSVEAATHGAVVSEFARTTELEGCEKGQAIAELASGKDKDDDTCAEEETSEESSDDSSDSTTEDDTTEESSEESAEESTDESADDEANHGAIVSEFARTTELEGCEKGQAIAELASSNAAEHRQNPDTDHDPCGDDTEQSTDETADDETSDVETDAVQADESPGRSGERGNNGGNGNGNGNGHGNGHGNGNGGG